MTPATVLPPTDVAAGPAPSPAAGASASAEPVAATDPTDVASATPIARPALVGIVGGSGYTGALLAELVLAHPSLKLAAMTSQSLAGEPVRRHLPRVRSELTFCTLSELNGLDVALLCLPHGASASVAVQLLDRGVRVIDLSADFRLDATTYVEWYGEHPHPELLPAVYGLTELHREAVAAADLVANPGCYPTAALLALAPLSRLGLVDVIIDAKSGVSGAGKQPKATTHFCSIDSDLVPYGLQTHRHYPEIAAGLARMNAAGVAGSMIGATGSVVATAPAQPPAPSLTFVPHLVPLQRGISETIYVKAGTVPLPSQDDLTALYEDFYASATFVEVCDAPPQLKDVAGTNYCRIYPHVDARAGRLVLVSVIDNLMKGASGQALQNLNVMLGRPEHEGLI